MAFTARTCMLVAGLVLAGCEDEPPQPEVGAITGTGHSANPVHTLRVSDGRLPQRTDAGVDKRLRLGVEADTRQLAERLAAAVHAARPGITLEAVARAELPTRRAALFLATRPLEGELPSSFTALPVALNALIVVVHPSNPLAERGLTLRELARLFSAHASGVAEVEYWGDIGVAGEWLEQPITRYGTAPGDSLHAYLREAVLEGAPVHADAMPRAGSASVVRAVAADVHAIGYAGLPFARGGVATVPIARARGRAFVAPSPRAIAARRYPLTGMLSMHSDLPEDGLPADVLALLNFIYSERGQAVVAESGYLPLPEQVTAATRQRLGLTSHVSPTRKTTEAPP